MPKGLMAPGFASGPKKVLKAPAASTKVVSEPAPVIDVDDIESGADEDPDYDELAELGVITSSSLPTERNNSRRMSNFAISSQLPGFSASSTKRKRPALSESISVVIRVKPILDHEKQSAQNKPVLTLTGDVISCDGNTPATKGTFAFDRVYGPETTQQQLHEDSSHFLVSQVIDGFNGTAFVYGQTGSGKTHTMMGDVADDEMAGIVPRSIQQIFAHANDADLDQFEVQLSLLEIYNEHVRDMISGTGESLDVREEKNGTFFVENLTKVTINSSEEALDLVLKGNENRAVSANNMHSDSSRSHLLLTLYVTKALKIGGTVQTTTAKLNLVDLAGSERYQEAGGKLAKEGMNINQSLSCLANVISALTKKGHSEHIPYRDSKLTRLLKDSLGGNCKTLMIANLHQSFSCLRETLSTLRYASRAKKIKNTARINADDVDDRVQDLMDEVAFLKDLLVKKDNFTRQMMNLFHETLNKQCVTGEEEVWEGASIDQLYRSGKAAMIQDDVVEEFREDLSSLMEIQLSLLEEKNAVEAARLEKLKLEEERVVERAELESIAAESMAVAEDVKNDLDKKLELLDKAKELELKTGYLWKKSAGLVKRWQKRYVVVSNHKITYQKDEKDKVHAVSIPLDGLVISEHHSISNHMKTKSMHMQSDDRSYFFSCDPDGSSGSNSEWITIIREAIIEYAKTHVDIKKATQDLGAKPELQEGVDYF